MGDDGQASEADFILCPFIVFGFIISKTTVHFTKMYSSFKNNKNFRAFGLKTMLAQFMSAW